MTPRAVDIIRKKRDGNELGPREIEAFVAGATDGSWPAYQVSALLMAIVIRGMSLPETTLLTRAMVASGITLDWSDLPGPRVDKHSTGGVGDKTSLVLSPIAAACNAYVPKMSGRGLGHTGGTLDKLESIPGFRVALSIEELRAALLQVGFGLVGQTKDIAPADKILYALRDVTATVDSIPLIASSIMSKKLAEGIDALIVDVKCGRGGFMKTLPEARELARYIVCIGTAHGVTTEAVITAMDHPLGNAVGNSLEIIECFETLKGRGPTDLEELALKLSARMLRVSGIALSDPEADIKVNAALRSGRALEKLQLAIAQQGGNPEVVDDYRLMPQAPNRAAFKAARSGWLTRMDAELIGRAAMVLGAGRNRVEDKVDHAVGALILVKPGMEVRGGAPILDLHYRDVATLEPALELVRQAITIADEPPAEAPLVIEVVDEKSDIWRE